MTHLPVSGASFCYQSTGIRNWLVCHTFLILYFTAASRRHRRLNMSNFVPRRFTPVTGAINR